MEYVYRASSQLLVLPIRILVIRCLPVSNHSHHVWEDSAWTVVFVSVDEDAQALEFVNVPKHIALLCALLGDPHCHSIAV